LGNAMGMLYDAYKAHSPLLLTAGQHDQSFTVTEPILWSDLPPVATPFVKWATEARRLEDLPRLVRRAVKTALAQPTGPFTLSLPSDVDPMPPGLDVVHLDVDPWELGKNYPAAIAIQGDPKASLPELCEAVRRHAGKAGHRDAGARRETLSAKHARERDDLVRRAADDAKKSPMGPLALVHAVSRVVPDDVVVVDEAISSSAGIRNF